MTSPEWRRWVSRGQIALVVRDRFWRLVSLLMSRRLQCGFRVSRLRIVSLIIFPWSRVVRVLVL